MYKQAQGGVIRLSDNVFIPPGHRDWFIYLQWVDDGGVPAPELTEEQLADRVAEAIATEGRKRIDAAGGSDARAQRRNIARAIKLHRKETQGGITPEETAELDAAELLFDKIDETEDLIETESNKGRTRAEMEGFDPATDIVWPI